MTRTDHGHRALLWWIASMMLSDNVATAPDAFFAAFALGGAILASLVAVAHMISCIGGRHDSASKENL